LPIILQATYISFPVLLVSYSVLLQVYSHTNYYFVRYH
jgi:hypothetical protein